MTKIKLCGLSRTCDIEAANELQPEYIGFVFAPKSRRYISPDRAMELKKRLAPGIKAVGVFVNESPETVAELLHRGVIDLAQLHGGEDAAYIRFLQTMTAKPVIQASLIRTQRDIILADQSPAKFVLLDSGSGTGRTFDWNLVGKVKKPFFLAGGLSPDNVANAVTMLHPFAVDVSSGIETDGKKDRAKMAAFVAAVRGHGTLKARPTCSETEDQK